MTLLTELKTKVYEVVHSSKWPLICVAACLIVWLTCVIAISYPGKPTNDTIAQLQQAVVGNIDNWKPALYAYILKILNIIFGERCLGSAFILQTILFGLGYALIVWNYAKRNSVFLWAMPLIFAFNAKCINITHIGNDALCAACFIMYIGLVLTARRFVGKKYYYLLIICSSIALFVGFTMRHNSFPAVLVLCMFTFMPICRNVIKSAMYSCLACIVLLGFNVALNNCVFKVKATYPLRFAYAVDMVNISILNNEWEPFCKAEQEKQGKELPLPATYCMLRADVCNFYETGLEPYKKNEESQTLKKINDAYFMGWQETVLNHPKEYLFLKAYFFHQFLLSGRSLPFIESWISKNYPHVSTYGDTICHDWRAWCNHLLVFNSIIPMAGYISLIFVMYLAYRKKSMHSTESKDALYMLGAAAAYTSTFSVFTLSSSEFRFYIVTSSLSFIGFLLLVIPLIYNFVTKTRHKKNGFFNT